MTRRRVGHLFSLVVVTLTSTACWGPFEPVRQSVDDRLDVVDLRNEDRTLERIVSRGGDRPDTRSVRGIERGASDPRRVGPAVEVPGTFEVSQPTTRSFTDPEGPTPDDEVSRLGGESGGDDVPESGDVRTDPPRDNGEIDRGSEDGRQLPGP